MEVDEQAVRDWGWPWPVTDRMFVACGAMELGAEGYSPALGLPPMVLFVALSVVGLPHGFAQGKRGRNEACADA